MLAERIIAFDLTKDAVVNEINKIPIHKRNGLSDHFKTELFTEGFLQKEQGSLNTEKMERAFVHGGTRNHCQAPFEHRQHRR